MDPAGDKASRLHYIFCALR